MAERREEPGSDELLGAQALEAERVRVARELEAARAEDERTAAAPADERG